MLFDPEALDELAQRLCALLPATEAPTREALLPQFRQLLNGGLQRLDLVGRAEFEVLRLALLRTRERLEQMEYRLLELEQLSPHATAVGD